MLGRLQNLVSIKTLTKQRYKGRRAAKKTAFSVETET